MADDANEVQENVRKEKREVSKQLPMTCVVFTVKVGYIRGNNL